MTAFETT
jgi:hypothetical protein